MTINIQVDYMEDLRALDSECGVRTLTLVKFDDLMVLGWEKLAEVLKSIALRALVFEGRGSPDKIVGFLEREYPDAHGVVTFLARP